VGGCYEHDNESYISIEIGNSFTSLMTELLKKECSCGVGC
jgi:hypothetical protein